MFAYAPQLLWVFLITSCVGILTTVLSIKLSYKLEILDRPDPRKSHRGPVAYLGGLGMLLAFLLGLVVMTWLFPGVVLAHRSTVFVILGGALAIFFIGFVDDVRPIPAILKLFLQLVIAWVMWYAGIRVEVLSLFGSGQEQIGMIVSIIITVGWYVALMNSINLVDGLDGLAGGICMIGALCLVGVTFFLDFSENGLIGAIVSTLTAAVALAFLFFNWHPAKIFMGDAGSLLLGFLLATSSIVGSTKTPTLLALSVPMVALGLPLFETGFSFLRRIVKGQHPFKPDRRHLHHRLLAIGLDQRRVVVILLFMTAFLGINSILLANSQSEILFVNVVFLIFGIVLMIENIKYLEIKRAKDDETIYEARAKFTKEADPGGNEKPHP